MASGKNPYGVSFIQTSTGAMITGEIKRYDTYKQMVEDPAPTRLASVVNASRDHQQYLEHVIDEDYTVPDEHIGGILYQHDFVNGTWILLYTEADLAVPTYVEWERILNVPPWVGGVSNHRVKLVENTYAVPRTTYYCYGNKEDLSKPYRLVLPPAGTTGLKLGDEIVLEQYENVSIVLYEKPDGVNAYPFEQTITDEDDNTYFYLYAVPYYSFEVDAQGKPVAGTEQPLTANIYRFIYTETDDGIKVWRPCMVKDNIDPAITLLVKRDVDHENASDPHPVYLKRSEIAQYFPTTQMASLSVYGVTRLASLGDIETGAIGSISVSPDMLKLYTTSHYSVLGHTHGIPEVNGLQAALDAKSNDGHTHRFYDLTGIPFETTLTVANQDSENTIVTPKMLYDQIHGHTHTIPEVEELQDILDSKSDVGHTHFLSSIVDYVPGIYSLSDTGLPFDDPRDCPGGYLKFPITKNGMNNKNEYLVVQWGHAVPGNNLEQAYRVGNIPYPLDVVMHVGFTILNDTTGGGSAIDPTGRDAIVQLRSLIRNEATALVTGFEYFLNRTYNDATDKYYRFLWIMIGIDRPTVDDNAKYSLVLEHGITPVVKYDNAQTIGFVRPFGNERYTSTCYIGMTTGSRANKAMMFGQLSSIAETIATRSPGSFTYFIQDSGDWANESNRYGRVDWLRLGINQYSANRLPIHSVEIDDWTRPSFDNDVGLLKSLEIPITKSTYYADQNYIAIPLSTTGSSIADIELLIEWGETESSTKQAAFEQLLNSAPDTIAFVDFVGRIFPTKNKKDQDVYEDELNWMAQYVDKTTNGFKYYSQLFSSTKNPIEYAWTMVGFRAMLQDNVPSAGTYDLDGHIVEIPIQFASATRNLVIEFGKETDKAVQNGTDNLYDLIVHRALTQVLRTAFTIDNPASSTNLDIEAELWNGPDNEFREPVYDLEIDITTIKYSLYRVRSAAAGKASFRWMVVGLTNEISS